MNKSIKALCLSIFLSVSIFAQTTTDNGGANNFDAADSNKPTTGAKQTTSSGYNKNEYYVGYSNQQTGRFGRSTFHGIEGSYTRNVSRWLGIRGSISYARSSNTFGGSLFDPTGTATYAFRQDNVRSVANFLGGIQIKDNASTKRFKPFAFALGGIAVNRSEFKNLACTSSGTTSCPTALPIANNVTFTDTGISGAFGGGLDIKINDKIDFRAIQFDYNPVYSDRRVDNNFRFGVGFVFK